MHTRTTAAIGSIAVVLLALSSSPAMAVGLTEMGHFDDLNHESYTAHDPNLCDGMLSFPVEWNENAVGTYRIVERKGQLYESFNGSFIGTWTNVDTGLGYHYNQRLNSGDQNLVPNDMGGFTLTFTDRFNVFWTDDLGRANLHDAGANTVTIEVDQNRDFVSFIDNRGRGRADTEGRDFCADLIEFTTP
ncbi:hypothetical protein ACH3VR_13255 [Microbacterium sp. B2969]|uniref:Uncharacterized protein n=1 Tax=Microbacterium alkaliflavum TaxID=3248839 RepID=A0ABW7Q922_9MICO